MSPTEKFADKVQALLNQASDPAATPEEAEAFSRKAEELMVKWGISDALLDAKRRKQKAKAEKILTEKIRVHGSFVRADVMVGWAAGDGLGNVRVIQSSGENSMTKYVWFIGFESDVQRAKILFESLLLQAHAARLAWWRDYEGKDTLARNQKKLAKRQFILTFAHVVHTRLEAMRLQTVEEASKVKSTELVLVDRKAKVDAYMDEEHANLKKGRALKGGSHDASVAGRKAGNEANLGGTQVEAGETAGAIE